MELRPIYFPEPLLEGVIIERKMQFLILVNLNGETVPCHCPTSWSIGNLNLAGRPCLLSRSKDPARKTKFTVKAGGVYQVGYVVNTDKALTAGARLLVNGTPRETSAAGGIAGLSLSRLSNEVLLRLSDNDEISLQIFNNPIGTALLPAPVGASLRIVRLS